MVIINKPFLGHPVFRIKDFFDLENGTTEVIFNTYPFIKSLAIAGLFCGTKTIIDISCQHQSRYTALVQLSLKIGWADFLFKLF